MSFAVRFVILLTSGLALGAVAGLVGEVYCGVPPLDDAIAGGLIAAFPAACGAFLLARLFGRAPNKVQLSTALILLCVSFVITNIGLSLPESKYILDLDIDTVYAGGYSSRKFATVELGMAESQVLGLLGEPISVQQIMGNHLYSELWYYSSDGALAEGDFAWRRVQVGFSEGVVVHRGCGWSCD